MFEKYAKGKKIPQTLLNQTFKRKFDEIPLPIGDYDFDAHVDAIDFDELHKEVPKEFFYLGYKNCLSDTTTRRMLHGTYNPKSALNSKRNQTGRSNTGCNDSQIKKISHFNQGDSKGISSDGYSNESEEDVLANDETSKNKIDNPQTGITDKNFVGVTSQISTTKPKGKQDLEPKELVLKSIAR